MGKKRKVSKAALEKQKAAAKKKAKKQDDNDYEDDEDDAYTALSRSLWTNKSANPKPPVGSLEKCAKCSKQFTVVRILGAVSLLSYLHSAERRNTRLPRVLRRVISVISAPRPPELTHSRNPPHRASASPPLKSALLPTSKRGSSPPSFRPVSRCVYVRHVH